MALEWVDVQIGRGYGKDITSWSYLLPHTPVEPATLTINVYGGSPLQQLADAADDHRTPFMSAAANRAGVLSGDAFGSVNHQTGQCQVSFCKEVPHDAEIFASYQWEPPEFRNCKIKIMTESGEERFIPIDDLRDALRRG